MRVSHHVTFFENFYYYDLSQEFRNSFIKSNQYTSLLSIFSGSLPLETNNTSCIEATSLGPIVEVQTMPPIIHDPRGLVSIPLIIFLFQSLYCLINA